MAQQQGYTIGNGDGGVMMMLMPWLSLLDVLCRFN